MDTAQWVSLISIHIAAISFGLLALRFHSKATKFRCENNKLSAELDWYDWALKAKTGNYELLEKEFDAMSLILEEVLALIPEDSRLLFQSTIQKGFSGEKTSYPPDGDFWTNPPVERVWDRFKRIRAGADELRHDLELAIDPNVFADSQRELG